MEQEFYTVEIIDRNMMLNFPTELIRNESIKEYSDHITCELLKFDHYDDPTSTMEFKYSIKFAYEIPKSISKIYVNPSTGVAISTTLHLKIYTIVGYKEKKLIASSIYMFPPEAITIINIQSADEFFSLQNNELDKGIITIPMFNNSNIIYDVIDEINCDMLL